MDKVIIDGVDVSKCSYAITPKRQCPNKPMPYAKETSCISCKEHNTKLNFCKNNPDCYYKQLQRLKEEKDGMQILINGYIELTEKYKQALQEIKEMAELFNCTYENKDLDKFKKQIQDKINEVIGAE